MSTVRTSIPFALLSLVIGLTPLHGQLDLTGQTPGGAYYTISAPPGWAPADGLVVWNHGFDLEPPSGPPDLGPLQALVLGQGYAVAASSYSLGGWALFATRRDLRELLEVFRRRFDEPQRILFVGASLGGAVTAQALEDPELGNVVGALSICGAVAGSRIWDGGLDLRLLYDLVCDGVPGASIPGGATGLPFPVPTGLDEGSVAAAVDACTGVSRPVALRTAGQRDRLERLLSLAGVPESFLLTDMGFATFGLADLLFGPGKLDGGQAVGNDGVDYGDPDVDARIERVAADPAARRLLLDHFTPTGRVGDARILSLHTDQDGLVPVENETAYASVVPPDNLTVAVVREDVPTHCGFTAAELVAAWDALRSWIAGAPQPTVADLQSRCESLAGGLTPGPCRYDPDFALPAFGERIPPREVCSADEETLCLNGGRFRVRVRWQDPGGNSGVGRGERYTPDTGLFWFFDPTNVELTVKVLDGRPINGRFWVFAASMTNVAFTLTVTDTHAGLERTYDNPQGELASFADTEAF